MTTNERSIQRIRRALSAYSASLDNLTLLSYLMQAIRAVCAAVIIGCIATVGIYFIVTKGDLVFLEYKSLASCLFLFVCGSMLVSAVTEKCDDALDSEQDKLIDRINECHDRIEKIAHPQRQLYDWAKHEPPAENAGKQEERLLP